MDKPVIILGARGIAKPAMEIFQSHNITIYCFLDDDKELHGKEIGEVAVMGRTDDDGFLKFIGKKCEAFVATDDNDLRRNLVEMLNERRKVQPVNAVHAKAYISPLAEIGHGNFINAGVLLGAMSKIGQHCIIHANATIDYEAVLEDFVQVGTGSIVGAGARVGSQTFIGSGVVVVPGINIGKGARIGAGSVVVADVNEGATLFGNPAKEI